LFWWGSVFLVAALVMLLVFGPKLLLKYRNANSGTLAFMNVVMSLLAVLTTVYRLKTTAEQGLPVSACGTRRGRAPASVSCLPADRAASRIRCSA
jgi:hypothetical protein